MLFRSAGQRPALLPCPERNCLAGLSHDKDVANARKIVAYLQQRHPVPDYELLLSQMAAVEKDSIQYKQHLKTFMTATGNSVYGGMYNKYLFNIEADEMNDAARS